MSVESRQPQPATESPTSVADQPREPAAASPGGAQAEWLRRIPPEFSGSISAADVDGLTKIAERYITRGLPDDLAELGAAVRRLASLMEAKVGHEATLRCLRDGFTAALTAGTTLRPGAAEAVTRLVTVATDSVWAAYTDALQEPLREEHARRFRQELMVAKSIQQRLLPKEIPNIPGFDIAGRVLPAAEVGGDYWSCKSYPEDDIVTLKLADVTGHGIAAATLVAAVKFISGGYYRGSKTAAQVMERTNTVLVRETPHEILVTMVYAWLYPHSAEITVVNAGHSPVLLYHAGEFRRIGPTGVALGLMETRYREVRMAMAPGDIFFTCSDGVTEPNPERFLGESWVQREVAAGAGLPAADLVQHLLDGALAFYGAPLDDMSILVVKRTE